MTHRKILLSSIIISLLSAAGLFTLAYMNNEDLTDFFNNSDGLIILFSTMIGFFLLSYVVLTLLTSAKKGARGLFILFIVLGGASWYAYASGVVYDIYDYMTVAENPYDGRYEPHNMSERIEEVHTKRPYSLSISGYSATLYGYDTNQPVRRNSYNVCLDGDKMFLRNGSLTISEYCGISSEGTMLELKFSSDAEGNLNCEMCEQAGFPVHWRKK
jgi:hypothetical protein